MKIRKLHFLLVILQFSGILFFLISGRVIPQNIGVAVFLLGSIVLGCWAIISMNRYTLSVLPDARENATLVTSGPYRFIRHPMYSAVLIFLFALLVNDFKAIRLLVFGAVAVVLIYKISIEEKILFQKYADYAAYCKSSKKLIPFLY